MLCKTLRASLFNYGMGNGKTGEPEGNDRRLEADDYFEFSFMDEIPGIDAPVLYVQGGGEGGNALADVQRIE